MFHFEHTNHLYLIIVLILLGVFTFFVLKRNEQLRKKLGSLIALEKLSEDRSDGKKIIKPLLVLLSALLLIIGLANPRHGNTLQKVNKEGFDLYIALDISKSMLAEDIQPNRMEKAKQFVQKFIDLAKGNRIGLILFAGNPYLQMPLSNDYAAAKLFTSTANPNLDITQGTAIESAIEMVENIKSLSSQNKQTALLVVTDGENHEVDAIDAARTAADNGTSTFIVSLGTEKGAPIPIVQNNNRRFKLDKNGQIVQSRLNAELLNKIAAAGNGLYVDGINKPDQAMQRLFKRMNGLEKSSFEAYDFDVFKSYYQYFVAFALILMTLEFVMDYKKNKWIS